MAVTMLVISILVFFIAQVVPVDPARNALGRYATEESVQELREKMGLDRPAIVQYTDWLTGIFQGDFGTSIHYQRPVSQLIWARLQRTLALAILGKPIDRILSIMGGIMVSIPAFAGGIFLIVIFALWLDWLPGASVPDPEDSTTEFIVKLALPILTLALDEIGYLTRLMRVSTAETMDSDFVRTAVLKGVPRRKVIPRHVLRNSMIAPFTAIMLHVNWLIGGVVVVEVLFNYPGLGSLLLDAALRNDIILLMGGTLVLTFVAVATQAVADIGVYFINPRLRFD
jgi:peptide/nickel transport system permease protein